MAREVGRATPSPSGLPLGNLMTYIVLRTIASIVVTGIVIVMLLAVASCAIG